MINRKNIFRILLASLLFFDTSLADERGDMDSELYLGVSYYAKDDDTAGNSMTNAPGTMHGGALNLVYDTGTSIKLEVQGGYSHDTGNSATILGNISGFVNAYYGLDFKGKFSSYIGLGFGLPSIASPKSVAATFTLGTVLGDFGHIKPYASISPGYNFGTNKGIGYIRAGIMTPLNF